jgi:hypothetical protein
MVNKTKKRNGKKQSFKNRIANYILKRSIRDVCCENEVDRDKLIDKILYLYKKIAGYSDEESEYLDWLNNDLLIFIGYYSDLDTNKDKEGQQLWKELDQKMLKNIKITDTNNYLGYKGQVDLDKIKDLLKEVPLFYLWGFLGFSYDKEENMRK